jgi:GntR family transcriptional regulator, transcriptional repressor for pyruvate dehydrogenase complex
LEADVPGDLFYPVQNRRSFEQVSERIKEAIVTGQLKPGDRLPPETELAARLEVSRQTIREALRTLEHAGLVETPRRGAGGGTVVRNAIPETITELFVDAMRMDSISVDELTEARATIEFMLIRFAVERADDEDLERLTENTKESRRLIAAGMEASKNDLDFHRLLAQCSNNRIVELVTDALLCVILSILSQNPPTLEMSIKSVERHEALLDALKRRDAEAAMAEMLQHLETVDAEIVQKAKDL